jgi:UDP-N-acetylglucosamine--N-acetylmuramyl-(pentapeptide) pyrophosphoryl-undecaprenol N-acetylglucosamine transferase
MRVLVAAGGSGGHIFPGLSFLDALKLKDPQAQVLLVLPKRSKNTVVLPEGCRASYISICPLKKRIDLSSFVASINLLKGIFESIFLLVEFKPDLVVGFGGIESVPIVFFAWFFRIKTLLHEQNVIPGRANRLLAKFVDRVAVSFPDSLGSWKLSPGRFLVTGNPIRRQLAPLNRDQAREFFGLQKDKFTILVMGGSQGSQRINTGALKAFSGLNNKSSFQVIHLSGPVSQDSVQNNYKSFSIDAKVFPFFGPMEYAYSAADLAIARAGATTISELVAFSLPAILVPYPYAYRHQEANARVLSMKGCAFIVKDEELEAPALRQAVSSCIANPGVLSSMRSQFAQFGKNMAAELLVKEAQGLVSLQ